MNDREQLVTLLMAELDIPIGTVMSRLARARGKVRDAVLGAARLRAVN